MVGSPILLEVIASSPEDCRRIEQGGGDRIELCSAMELGGLTPSLGLLEACLEATRLPIMAMVRPRTGGFCYSPSEFEAMVRDIRRFRETGARGVVFGVLDEKRLLDHSRNVTLVKEADELETVFHRAFDATVDLSKTLEGLIEIGFTRVLTSGGRPTAMEGAGVIQNLIDRAEGRIQILPGSGIRSHNLAELIRVTRANQVHTSAFEATSDSSMKEVGICFNGRGATEDFYRSVNSDLVREIAISIPS